MQPRVTKRTREGSAYFTIWWSPAFRLQKAAVNGGVPSLPGIYEIYRTTGGTMPELVGRSRAYYGGLRNTLRGLIDTISPYPLNGTPLDLSMPHYARYTVMESAGDMDDILYFFAARSGGDDTADDSGRYEFIYVKEEALGADGRPL